jgi:hypothetical protein
VARKRRPPTYHYYRIEQENIMTKNSVIEFTGTGVQDTFAVNFTSGYMEEAHVTVRVNNEEDGAGSPIYRTITFVSEGIMRVGGDVPALGAPVVFRRITPIIEPVYDYSAGAIFSADAIDTSFDQLLKSVQETHDGIEDLVNTGDAVDAAEAAADAARAARDEAMLYEGPFLDSIDALLADTTLTYAIGAGGSVTVGDYIQTRDGYSFVVLGSTDEDYADITVGGVRLAYAGPETGLRTEDVGAMLADMSQGELRLVVLGDSTEAGVGNSSGSGNPYGFARPLNHGGAWNMFYYSAIMAGPEFIPPNKDTPLPLFGAFQPETGTTSTIYAPMDNYRLVASDTPEGSFKASVKKRVESDVFSVYVMKRAADEAARFRIRLTSEIDGAGTVYATEIIDTYTAPEPLVSGATEDKDGFIEAVPITLTTAVRECYVTIDTVDVVDRGNGVAADGTAVILGFVFDHGLKFRNYAVSSMTLLNESAANVGRDVTTDFMFDKATAYNGNTYVVGFGTNDSKDGVSTRPAFRADLVTRVNELIAANSKAQIILETAPTGAGIYSDNVQYNQDVRSVARQLNVSLVDRQKIFDKSVGNSIKDDVHPSEDGYIGLSRFYTREFGIRHFYDRPSFIEEEPLRAYATDTGTSSVVNATSTFSTVLEQVGLRVLAGSRQVAVSATVSLADTADIEEACFEIEVASAGGTTATLDTKIVSAPVVGSTALTSLHLQGVYELTNPLDNFLTVRLRGKQFRLRTGADGTTSLITKML